MGDERDAFRRYLRTGARSPELRAMGDSGTGGFLFPAELQAELAVTLKEYAALVADFSPIETDHGRPLKYPVRNFAGSGTSTVGSLVAENPAAGGGPDGGSTILENDAVFNQATLNAYTFTSDIHQISMQLEEDSALPIEGVVRDFSAEAIGRALSAYSISGLGVGSSQPLGVIPAASAQGASGAGTSGGYVQLPAAATVKVLGNAATTELTTGTLSPQSLSAMINAIDPAYYPTSAWYMSPVQWSNTLLLSDSSSRPFAQFTDGVEKNLMGFPVKIANEIPALAASTVGGPVFGSLSKGMFYRSAGFEVLRLKERYAEWLQVGFVGYHRADFQVRDARAFVTVKPAAT